MSCKRYSVSGLTAIAAFAIAASGSALADDSSMSLWTGDSYAYFNGGRNFPFGSPVLDKRPSTFRTTDPHGLSPAEYQARSSDGRPWPAPNSADPATIASMAAAKDWRHDHPHGLPNSVYEALSADGRPWPSANSGPVSAVASADAAEDTTNETGMRFIAAFSKFFGGARGGRGKGPSY